jgi:hypothetical protein
MHAVATLLVTVYVVIARSSYKQVKAYWENQNNK